MMPLIRGVFIILSFFFLKLSFAWELKSGDVLLQPLHCWVCNLIEAQTKSPYSHIGIVIKKDQKFFVLEAWQKVKLTPIKEFLLKTQKDLKVKVVRHKYLTENELEKLMTIAAPLIGLPYDNEYRLNNLIDGKEAYYCSELVYVALLPLTSFLPSPKLMPYDIYPEHWDRYFRGNTPRGELGVAPSHFDDPYFFDEVGEL